ncbi:MAG TPA: hypothetical protein VF950_16305 [Planctomycetota bacterium]
MNCTIPWLQDTPAAQVWTSWGGVQRQIQILDRFNFKVATFDTLLNPLALANDTNWNALKALLKQVAGEP